MSVTALISRRFEEDKNIDHQQSKLHNVKKNVVIKHKGLRTTFHSKNLVSCKHLSYKAMDWNSHFLNAQNLHHQRLLKKKKYTSMVGVIMIILAVNVLFFVQNSNVYKHLGVISSTVA